MIRVMNKKYLYFTILFAVGALFVWFIDGRVSIFYRPLERGRVVEPEKGEQSLRPAASRDYEVEEVATGLVVPWDIAFTSADRMLVTERPGRVRVIEQGRLLERPLHVFGEVVADEEEGLMSAVLDPDYQQNRFVYFSLAYQSGTHKFVKVVRLRDEGERLADEFAVIEGIPAAAFHSGSRIRFGPDGKLYITTGDATDRNLAQDLDSLAGKILRLNPDGSIPDDNPIAGSPVWSRGHRNPQGLDWHPVTGELYSTEHGPSGFDGPGGGDEVNRIIKGTNYGWPLVSHQESIPEAKDPLLVFTPAEAPASAMIYGKDSFPVWRGNLFFGALRGEGIIRMVIDEGNPDKIVLFEKLARVNFGRVRTIAQGPDGYIYFTTSNRDGRGNPAPADDRIFRIRPKD